MNPNITAYSARNVGRQAKLEDATMYFMQYFLDLGDDLDTARQKVSEVSTEVAAWLFPYVLGNTQPLIDALNNSTLPYMDADAKANIIGNLS